MNLDDERLRRQQYPERYASVDAETQRERDHLTKTLAHYLARVGAALPRVDGVLNILSVGCGTGYEAGPILNLFPGSRYKGIDIDEDSLRGAKYTNLDLADDRVEFQPEDARNVLAGETGKYGLIVARHPAVYGDTFGIAFVMALIRAQELATQGQSPYEAIPTWQDIFKASAAKLSTGGYLLSTTLGDPEHQAVLSCLRQEQLEVVTDEPNQASRINSSFSDQFIAVGRKS